MKPIRFWNTVQSKIILIYVLLILIAMQIIGVYFVKTMERTFESSFQESLQNRAMLLSQYVRQTMVEAQQNADSEDVKAASLQELVDNFNQISGAEVQIVDLNSVVLSASNDMLSVGKKKTQKEITQALKGYTTEKKVIDAGTRKYMLVMPVRDYEDTLGVVYVLGSMEDIYTNIDNLSRIFIVGILFALALTVILGIILANTITKPIKDMTRKIRRIGDGQFDEKVNVIGQDEISQLGTAYNEMMQKLQDALSENEEEKEKLSSILSNMSDGVIAIDDRGKVILVNRRAAQMLGKENMNLIGMDIAKLIDLESRSLTKQKDSEGNELDPSFLVQLNLSPLRKKGELVLGTVIVLQDVTEQEKMEGLRREFVANVSHELRTPLTSIKSYVEALNDGAVEDVELRNRFMGVLQNETERMIRLVNDLLQLSRLDSSRETLQLGPGSLAFLIEEVADRFHIQAQQREVKLKAEIDKQIAEHRYVFDADKLDQVLNNLVSNALKFTPDGGAITLKAKKIEDYIEISVQDTGIGIPEKDLPRIFERFYRVDKARTRNQGGTGLGLSISREIVQAHGGAISIQSALNKGTTVRFRLPAIAEEVGVE